MVKYGPWPIPVPTSAKIVSLKECWKMMKMYGALVNDPRKDGQLLKDGEAANRLSSKRTLSVIAGLSLVLCFLLGLLASTAPSQKSTQEANSSGSSSSSTAQFDFYLMAMSWQPQYCYLYRSSQYPGCESPDDYWKSHWTIHGLWPQYNDGSYPSSCSNEKASATLFQSLSMDLEQYWPDLNLTAKDDDQQQPSYSFWRHEWSKHGTCTGLTPDEYFATALTYQLPTPSAVGEAYGQSLSQADLLSALQYDVVIRCSNGIYLQEVRACLTAQGALMDCPPSLESNCNQEYIRIASFPSDE